MAHTGPYQRPPKGRALALQQAREEYDRWRDAKNIYPFKTAKQLSLATYRGALLRSGFQGLVPCK